MIKMKPVSEFRLRIDGDVVAGATMKHPSESGSAADCRHAAYPSHPARSCHRTDARLPEEGLEQDFEMKLVLNNKPAAPSTPDPGLLAMLKQSHRLLRALTDGTGLTTVNLATRERMDVSDLSRVIRFAR